MPPRRDIDRLQGEIEELFRDLWQVPRYLSHRAGFRPLVDCFRTDDPPMLTIVVELAGVGPDDLRIEVAERELVVTGERTRPPCPGRVYQQMEIEYGDFERRVALADPVDTAGARAEYEHGMLTITLPLARRSEAQGRIPIVVHREAGT